jgi:hypothetical protein
MDPCALARYRIGYGQPAVDLLPGLHRFGTDAVEPAAAQVLSAGVDPLSLAARDAERPMRFDPLDGAPFAVVRKSHLMHFRFSLPLEFDKSRAALIDPFTDIMPECNRFSRIRMVWEIVTAPFRRHNFFCAPWP